MWWMLLYCIFFFEFDAVCHFLLGQGNRHTFHDVVTSSEDKIAGQQNRFHDPNQRVGISVSPFYQPAAYCEKLKPLSLNTKLPLLLPNGTLEHFSRVVLQYSTRHSTGGAGTNSFQSFSKWNNPTSWWFCFALGPLTQMHSHFFYLFLSHYNERRQGRTRCKVQSYFFASYSVHPPPRRIRYSSSWFHKIDDWSTTFESKYNKNDKIGTHVRRINPCRKFCCTTVAVLCRSYSSKYKGSSQK